MRGVVREPLPVREIPKPVLARRELCRRRPPARFFLGHLQVAVPAEISLHARGGHAWPEEAKLHHSVGPDACHARSSFVMIHNKCCATLKNASDEACR